MRSHLLQFAFMLSLYIGAYKDAFRQESMEGYPSRYFRQIQIKRFCFLFYFPKSKNYIVSRIAFCQQLWTVVAVASLVLIALWYTLSIYYTNAVFDIWRLTDILLACQFAFLCILVLSEMLEQSIAYSLKRVVEKAETARIRQIGMESGMEFSRGDLTQLIFYGIYSVCDLAYLAFVYIALGRAFSGNIYIEEDIVLLLFLALGLIIKLILKLYMDPQRIFHNLPNTIRMALLTPTLRRMEAMFACVAIPLLLGIAFYLIAG